MTVPGGVVELVEFDGILGEVDLKCKTESTESSTSVNDVK